MGTAPSKLAQDASAGVPASQPLPAPGNTEGYLIDEGGSPVPLSKNQFKQICNVDVFSVTIKKEGRTLLGFNDVPLPKLALTRNSPGGLGVVAVEPLERKFVVYYAGSMSETVSTSYNKGDYYFKIDEPDAGVYAYLDAGGRRGWASMVNDGPPNCFMVPLNEYNAPFYDRIRRGTGFERSALFGLFAFNVRPGEELFYCYGGGDSVKWMNHYTVGNRASFLAMLDERKGRLESYFADLLAFYTESKEAQNVVYVDATRSANSGAWNTLIQNEQTIYILTTPAAFVEAVMLGKLSADNLAFMLASLENDCPEQLQNIQHLAPRLQSFLSFISQLDDDQQGAIKAKIIDWVTHQQLERALLLFVSSESHDDVPFSNRVRRYTASGDWESAIKIVDDLSADDVVFANRSRFYAGTVAEYRVLIKCIKKTQRAKPGANINIDNPYFYQRVIDTLTVLTKGDHRRMLDEEQCPVMAGFAKTALPQVTLFSIDLLVAKLGSYFLKMLEGSSTSPDVNLTSYIVTTQSLINLHQIYIDLGVIPGALGYVVGQGSALIRRIMVGTSQHNAVDLYSNHEALKQLQKEYKDTLDTVVSSQALQGVAMMGSGVLEAGSADEASSDTRSCP